MFRIYKEPKVLLVLPTTDQLVKLRSRSSTAPAYGLNILATALRQEGMETIVLDELIMRSLSTLSHQNTWVEAIEYILDYYPTIKCLGVSILTNFRKVAIQLSRSIKISHPDIMIVWGGPHVTSLGELLYDKYYNISDLMISGVVDIDIIKYLKESLSSQDKKIQSSFLKGDPSKDIAKHIFPDYKQYLRGPQNSIDKIITRTSIGCPNAKCIFCSALFLEGHYCIIDLKTVLNEIKRLIDYSPKRIEFHDQDFCFSLDRLKNILSIDPPFDIKESYCHSDLHSLTIEHLDLFMGTHIKWEIFLGLESASNEIRQYLGKKLLADNVDCYLNRLNEHIIGSNVKLGLFVMFGVPIETPAHLKETKELLQRLHNIDICFMLMKVFPGTPIARRLIMEGRIDINIWLDENGPPVVPAVFGEQLERSISTWQEMLSIFASSHAHNKIDRKLLDIDY